MVYKPPLLLFVAAEFAVKIESHSVNRAPVTTLPSYDRTPL